MHDQINNGEDTDRVLVSWDLRAADVAAACAGKISPASAEAEIAAGARVALSATPDGRPALSAGWPASPAGTVLVAVPADIERLRVTDPAAATAWRAAVRDTLGALMARAGRVTGFDRAGWYVIAGG